jgi:hypothetical protein
VNPQRLLEGFSWPEFKWRRGELVRASTAAAAAAGGEAVQQQGMCSSRLCCTLVIAKCNSAETLDPC